MLQSHVSVMLGAQLASSWPSMHTGLFCGEHACTADMKPLCLTRMHCHSTFSLVFCCVIAYFITASSHECHHTSPYPGCAHLAKEPALASPRLGLCKARQFGDTLCQVRHAHSAKDGLGEARQSHAAESWMCFRPSEVFLQHSSPPPPQIGKITQSIGRQQTTTKQEAWTCGSKLTKVAKLISSCMFSW
eukprot:1160944-Pelagomonas_calceolata.AAC.4